MPDHTYLIGGLLDGTLREEMPFSGAGWSHVLNRPGAFGGVLPLRHDKVTRSNLEPGSTTLFVLRDGQPQWGGIIWTAQAKTAEGTLEIGAEGFHSYFRRRHLHETRTYDQVDQHDIVRDLLTYAQSRPRGDVGVVLDAVDSGVLRDQTWWYYEKVNIGEQIENLSKRQNGFDFAYEVSMDTDGNPVVTFVPSYPRRGRKTGLVFDLAANINLLSETVDATTLATETHLVGAGEAESMLLVTVADQDPGNTPLLEAVEAYKDISVPETLLSRAQTRQQLLRLPFDLPEVEVRPSPDTQVGSFIEGDEVEVRASDGWAEVSGLHRILAYSVNIGDDGTEVVKCQFQDVRATEAA